MAQICLDSADGIEPFIKDNPSFVSGKINFRGALVGEARVGWGGGG